MLINAFRKAGIAMGIAILGLLAMTSEATAQRVRRPPQETTATRLAQQPPQIPPAECTDRGGSGQAAAEAREAFRSRNFLAAQAAWERAVALCGLPDRFEGRARTAEARQGQLPDGEERLSLLDDAIEDFREAIARRTFVQGFETSAIEATVPTLVAMRADLNRRLHPAVVPPRPSVPACTNTTTDPANCGRCGNACAAGQSCVAGACRAATVPTTPHPPAPSRTLARALWIGGAVATVTGAVLGTIGRIGAIDRDEYNALLAAPASQRCRTTVGGQTECLGYAPGATRPEAYAALETPGWVVAGVGVAAVVAGVVLELRAGRHATESRPGPTVRPNLAFGPDGIATVGIGGTF